MYLNHENASVVCQTRIYFLALMYQLFSLMFCTYRLAALIKCSNISAWYISILLHLSQNKQFNNYCNQNYSIAKYVNSIKRLIKRQHLRNEADISGIKLAFYMYNLFYLSYTMLLIW